MADDVQYYEATRQYLIRDIANGTEDTAIVDEIGNLKVERVLDIGCGIGQALHPLAVKRGAFGVGIDISNFGLRMGREFYAANVPEAKVAFMNARAESLPFESESFDLVNFGLALPYTHNPRAIAEVERVLRPGGLFLLKIHHVRYYLQKMSQGLFGANLLSMIHCGRVLTNGTIYHLSGRQPMTRILNETFQTRWMLKRELKRSGMIIDSEQADANPAAPVFYIRKKRVIEQV
jgi:ubiquinone/menaquinone biosynthesis C-methylase UbiE